ncbi:tRNA-guanine transglycosylase DpdA [Rhodospirillales bacterium]|nr:tRNA-guanine transglycosylase DpdA [Rhodospirillales bacterium]
MKFLYADGLDFVDPNYNFLEDRSQPGREPYWDDEFMHEHLEEPPFDGYLVSRSIVLGHYIENNSFPAKYTMGQSQRLLRKGVRKFLRIDNPKYDDLMIMGDCGAYSYHKLEKPPYSPKTLLEFYSDGGFTHGCSVDHIIFQFDRNLSGMEAFRDTKDPDAGIKIKDRWDITQENAEVFLRESKQMTTPFIPLGVIQGWSPGSMAKAAHNLVAMGYDYLALGGMAVSAVDTIQVALEEIRKQIPDYIKLHLLGFGKVDQIDDIMDYNVTSIDTTSPMLRAFKDVQRSFFMPGDDSGLKYYASVRIPQATENAGLKLLVKKGVFSQEYLIQQEKGALTALRNYDQGKVDMGTVLGAVMAYTKSVQTNPKTGAPPTKSKMSGIKNLYTELLNDRPWSACDCAVCRKASIEVAIFRASNRNKRRGMHNTWVFNNRLKQFNQKGGINGSADEIFSDQSKAK